MNLTYITKNGKVSYLTGSISKETEKAMLVYFSGFKTGTEMWLPKSQMTTLENGEVEIPAWLGGKIRREFFRRK
ncbi:hypothetical protein H8D04_00615 [bacterium]|nr:hypothetical protein [bacterium]